ncbi:hypothetical protein I7I51_02821 [Histoplasma capsulatum]|uniref:Uncharacterized protein n=1 Tax=Ajellomyces capsulatus TaxID=5037 RepID=A0A8A1MPR2_AJECA|nr:hypothetical protein I7I51_02821 [Histoplasma capsulatum]
MHQRRQQSSKWTLAANSLLGGLQYLVRGRYTTTGQLWYGEGGICQVPHPPLARRQQTAHDRFSQMKLKPTPGHTLNWNWVSLAMLSIAPFATGGFQGRDISRVRSPSALPSQLVGFLTKQSSPGSSTSMEVAFTLCHYAVNLAISEETSFIRKFERAVSFHDYWLQNQKSKPFDKLSLRAPALVQAQTLPALTPRDFTHSRGGQQGLCLEVMHHHEPN